MAGDRDDTHQRRRDTDHRLPDRRQPPLSDTDSPGSRSNPIGDHHRRDLLEDRHIKIIEKVWHSFRDFLETENLILADF